MRPAKPSKKSEMVGPTTCTTKVDINITNGGNGERQSQDSDLARNLFFALSIGVLCGLMIPTCVRYFLQGANAVLSPLSSPSTPIGSDEAFSVGEAADGGTSWWDYVSAVVGVPSEAMEVSSSTVIAMLGFATSRYLFGRSSS